MGKIYSNAEAVEEIAGGLLPNYHPELATARILYMFVDTASVRNGKPVLGKVQKVTGWTEYAVERDFLMLVPQDEWDRLAPDQRTALVDHLLERCTGEEDDETGEMKWKIRDPDVQEFSSILQRYGAWHEDLRVFVTVAQEIKLDELIEEEAGVDLDDEMVVDTHVAN